MNSKIKLKSPSLYEIDYQLWLEITAAQLRSHDFSPIDLENLLVFEQPVSI